MEKHVYSVFSSLILESTDSEFECREDLLKWIANYMENDPDGIVLSNRGGWQSSSGRFFKEDKSFRSFSEYISQRIGHLINDVISVPVEITDLWINVNRPGSYNVEHNHPESDIAGCIWIHGPEESGNFVLKNPNGFVDFKLINALSEDVRLTSHVVIHAPTPGKMILFPSHLKHLVETNNSNEDRVSIAFNLSFV